MVSKMETPEQWVKSKFVMPQNCLVVFWRSNPLDLGINDSMFTSHQVEFYTKQSVGHRASSWQHDLILTPWENHLFVGGMLVKYGWCSPIMQIVAGSVSGPHGTQLGVTGLGETVHDFTLSFMAKWPWDSQGKGVGLRVTTWHKKVDGTWLGQCVFPDMADPG